MKNRTDKALLILTVLFVGGLAIVAGAISFAHMRELATHHDQLGWKSFAFPISVDGLEIVASLYVVVHRRAGRSPGWIPWIALIVGTLASLAANVAVGGADPIGKALAGWPAVSMLVSVKLLFSMIDHNAVDQRTTVRDDQRTSPTVPDVPGTVHRTGRDEQQPSRTVPTTRADDRHPSDRPTPGAPAAREAPATPSAPGQSAPGRIGGTASPVDLRTVAHLIPAARTARATLARDGRPLSRDNLADAMREDGNAVSNARASLLIKILKAELGVTTIGVESIGPEPLPEDVA